MRAARLAVLVLVMTTVVAIAPATADRSTPLAVNAVAPDFELADQHGRPLRLSELLARRNLVVIAFYVKAFTGGWDLEFSRFRDDHPKYEALNAEIIGISADPPARNLAWTRELTLPFRLLSDVDGRIARQWGVWDDTWNLAHRATFVVDRSRRIRWVDAGRLAIDVSRTLDAVTKLAAAR